MVFPLGSIHGEKIKAKMTYKRISSLMVLIILYMHVDSVDGMHVHVYTSLSACTFTSNLTYMHVSMLLMPDLL